ncbi:MlaE family lipid ABC transporter permease subunit [bacterium]|nr:MlaE family lipid ABC transporter permease subunit [bacterium]
MADIYQKENTLFFSGPLTIATVGNLEKSVREVIRKNPGKNITFDFSAVSYIDTVGVAFLDEMKLFAVNQEKGVDFQNAIPQVLATIADFSTLDLPEQHPPEINGFFEKIGEMAFNFGRKFTEVLYLIADIFYWSAVGLFKHKGARKGSFIQQSLAIGADSVPIISLISLLIGFILALQSAGQMRQFGANIYVVDLVGIAITAEMGPLITAIVLAGRSGSAFASEIATMMVTEEVDALKMMGMNPIRFIVVPKFHAITLTLPLLTILANFLGLFGGFIVCVTYLQLSPNSFFNELMTVIFVKDIVAGLVKSLAYAWIIIIVGAYCGFNVKGGAEGVGRVTTSSVVISIFAIIVADSILGILFYFGR